MSSETEQLTTAGVTTNLMAKHPLLIETVVECLFSHLDFPSLKVARLVCKPWREAAMDYFLEQGVVRFGAGRRFCEGDVGAAEVGIADIDNLTKRMTALSLLDKRSSLASMGLEDQQRFKNYMWVNAQAWKVPNPVQDYFVNFGHHVKSLKLQRPRTVPDPLNPDAITYESSCLDLEFLVEILETCPNLEELEMFCSASEFQVRVADVPWLDQLERLRNLEKPKLKNLTLLLESGIYPMLLQMLLLACPLLESFSVTYRLMEGNEYNLLWFLFQVAAPGRMNGINLGHLRRLDIAWHQFEAISETIQEICCVPLPSLSFLRIAISNQVDEGTFNEMLEHLSGSLCHLHLSSISRDAPVLGFIPRIPPTMTKLKTLEFAVNGNQLLMGVLESAVNLPRLKELILHREPLHETCDYVTHGAQYDFTQCWSSLPANWAEGRHEGIRTLQLHCGLTQADHLLQVLTVFSAVRDLRLQNPSSEVIRAVFTAGTHLERLSLRLLTFSKKIDSTLTGLRSKICSHMVKEGKYRLKDPNQVTDWGPGLRDMKNLQYFELRQWNQSNWLTEVSLWQGLMYLTRANHLELGLGPSHRLPESSIAALKSTLDPRCIINIDTRVRDPPTMGTPQTQLCYWEFWARDSAKTGMWKPCCGLCCKTYK